MEYSEFKNLIVDRFKWQLDLDLTDDKVLKFYDFMNLLIETNKVINLTAITEPQDIIVKHFLDSSILYKIDLMGKSDLKIIDVGTGAGFPGIPLSIILSDNKFVLTDTLGKRIKFLDKVVTKLNLENVELVKARAEDLAQDKDYRGRFDICVSRAVANMSTLSEYTLPFVKVGGKMFAYKMDDCGIELVSSQNAIRTLGGLFHVKHAYSIIDNEPQRAIVEIFKIKETPKQYPRKAGTPSKSPLQ